MNFDLNSLTGGTTNPTTSLLDPSRLLEPIMPFIIITTVVAVVIAVLYVINAVTTWRSHRATIEMRNILREMNARDKARNHSATATVSNPPTDP